MELAVIIILILIQKRKKLLSFDDVFKPNQQAKLKELLWERYTRYGEVKDEEAFTSKDAFE